MYRSLKHAMQETELCEGAHAILKTLLELLVDLSREAHVRHGRKSNSEQRLYEEYAQDISVLAERWEKLDNINFIEREGLGSY